MLKKSKLMVSIAMLVQSFTLFILFLILCVKKRSIAAACLAVSAMEGATGAYLFFQAKEELEKNDFDPSDYLDDDLYPDGEEDEPLDLNESSLNAELYRDADEPEEPVKKEIPLDDDASEEEFKNR